MKQLNNIKHLTNNSNNKRDVFVKNESFAKNDCAKNSQNLQVFCKNDAALTHDFTLVSFFASFMANGLY